MSNQVASLLMTAKNLVIIAERYPRALAEKVATNLLFSDESELLAHIEAKETINCDFALSIDKKHPVVGEDHEATTINFESIEEIEVTWTWRKGVDEGDLSQLAIFYNLGDQVTLRVSNNYPTLIEVEMRPGFDE